MPQIVFATINESVHITIATTAEKRQLVAIHQNSEKLHGLTVRYGRAKMIDRLDRYLLEQEFINEALQYEAFEKFINEQLPKIRSRKPIPEKKIWICSSSHVSNPVENLVKEELRKRCELT